ncbi:MAG: TIGR00282 family metallophosphoesterase [Spirochaetes bacterium]|nr:TIGR00282 family metallophosphoesterase [Spirochaetota bacterium]
MRILYIGEIVGRAGVFALKKMLPAIKRDYRVDFTIGCADGVTGGAGVGKAHSVYLRKVGLEVATTGDCAFYKKDIVEQFPKAPWMLRPANYPQGVPGRGFRVFAVPPPQGQKAGSGAVAVIQLLGQSGFTRVHLANPFLALQDIIERVRRDLRDLGRKAVVLDFHAATTAEKRTMFAYADGLVSAVIGSHCRTLTADAAVSAKGTASITDAGRTGSLMSVGGMDAAARIREYLTGVPEWARDAVEGIELQGCLVETDDDGHAVSIETIRKRCEEVFHDRTGNSNEA